ncbi:inositol phosphatase [Kipferlia bialata]|uniref:Inositol phosphatase n=1 Tax=Kipferlia bialata TaxID=797122 RepID=A0A9K3GL32_9EUKA|nr:inositol phosphatase [Kipferlia bialata]|eukprot:g8880.t1
MRSLGRGSRDSIRVTGDGFGLDGDNVSDEEVRDRAISLATAGNIIELGLILKSSAFWQPNQRQARTIASVEKDLSMQIGEIIVKSYVVESINSFNQEQLRVLTLTNMGYHRSKCDFKRCNMVSSKFVPLSSVDRVVYGRTYSTKYSASYYMANTKKDHNPWAIRVHFKTHEAQTASMSPSVPHPASTAGTGGSGGPEGFRTFRAHITKAMLSSAPGQVHSQDLMSELVIGFKCLFVCGGRDITRVFELDITRDCPGRMAFVSVLYNALNIGTDKDD